MLTPFRTLAEALESKSPDDTVLRRRDGFFVTPATQLQHYMCSQLHPDPPKPMVVLDEWSESPFNLFVDLDSETPAEWMEASCVRLAHALVDETHAMRKAMGWTRGGCPVAMVFCRRAPNKTSAHVILSAERGFGEVGVVALLVLLALTKAPPQLLDTVDVAPYGTITNRRVHLRPPMSNKTAKAPCYLHPHAVVLGTRVQTQTAWDSHQFARGAEIPVWLTDQLHGITHACTLRSNSDEPGILLSDLPAQYRRSCAQRLAQWQLPDQHPVSTYARTLQDKMRD